MLSYNVVRKQEQCSCDEVNIISSTSPPQVSSVLLKPFSWKYRANTAQPELRPQEVSHSPLYRAPNLSAVASLATSFAICTCLTADGIWKKTRPIGYVFWCKHSKSRKAKEKVMTYMRRLQLWPATMTCLHHYVTLRFCSSFAPLLCASCSVAKFCYFSDWLFFIFLGFFNVGWLAAQNLLCRHFVLGKCRGAWSACVERDAVSSLTHGRDGLGATGSVPRVIKCSIYKRMHKSVGPCSGLLYNGNW